MLCRRYFPLVAWRQQLQGPEKFNRKLEITACDSTHGKKDAFKLELVKEGYADNLGGS